MRTVLTALIVMLIGITAALAASLQQTLAGMEASCSTDSDCMTLCPADDAECDGGPQ